jgi:hypothetical protein
MGRWMSDRDNLVGLQYDHLAVDTNRMHRRKCVQQIGAVYGENESREKNEK